MARRRTAITLSMRLHVAALGRVEVAGVPSKIIFVHFSLLHPQAGHGPADGAAAAGSSLGGGRGVVSRAGLHWSMALLLLLATWFYMQVSGEGAAEAA